MRIGQIALLGSGIAAAWAPLLAQTLPPPMTASYGSMGISGPTTYYMCGAQGFNMNLAQVGANNPSQILRATESCEGMTVQFSQTVTVTPSSVTATPTALTDPKNPTTSGYIWSLSPNLTLTTAVDLVYSADASVGPVTVVIQVQKEPTAGALTLVNCPATASTPATWTGSGTAHFSASCVWPQDYGNLAGWVGGESLVQVSILKKGSLSTDFLFNTDIYPKLNLQNGDNGQSAPSYPSGFSPGTPSDTLFLANAPQTGCLYGKDGPVVIKIPITRYVGETTPSGSLANPALLKANHVVSGYARLTLPVWDVDPTVQNGISEVDVLTVNGNRIDPVSTLMGADRAWRLNEFMVPIEDLRFPALNAQVGGAPDTSVAVNNIEIDIDTGSPNHDLWCAGFEWAQLSFSAMAPVVLVHGTAADHTSWDDTPEFKGYLDSVGIPYYYQTVDLGPNTSSDHNANNLCNILNQLAVWYGSNSFNLIAHSKGATDSRRFFNQNYRNPGCSVGVGPAPVPFVIQTLTSLDTPSQGTMLSDVSVATLSTSFGTQSNDPNVDSLLSSSWLASWAGAPQPPALTLQTIAGMVAFNAANTLKPPGVKYFSVAADADVNMDGHVDCSEAKPLLGSGVCAIGADAMYQVLGHVTAVTVVKKTVTLYSDIGPYEQTYDFVQATRGAFMPNDLTSTVDSAHYTRDFTPILTTVANHSNVKNAATAQVVVGRIQEAFPVGLYPP